jgi:hypothetical protein
MPGQKSIYKTFLVATIQPSPEWEGGGGMVEGLVLKVQHGARWQTSTPERPYIMHSINSHALVKRRR